MSGERSYSNVTTTLVYCSLLSTLVAVVLSSDNFLFITLSHAASTSLSVYSLPQIALLQRNVQIRYADSDMMIFSRRVAPGLWCLLSIVCPVSSFFFCAVSTVSVLHPIIVPSD